MTKHYLLCNLPLIVRLYVKWRDIVWECVWMSILIMRVCVNEAI